MPADPTTRDQLEALAEVHADLGLVRSRILEALDRDEIGSVEAKNLLGILTKRKAEEQGGGNGR